MKTVIYLGTFLLLFARCQSPAPAAVTTIAHPEKKVVLDQLLHPWSMAFLSEDEVLITEKDGHLIRANLISKTKQVIAGFPNDLKDSIRIKSRIENSGIFEVLLDPDFSQNQYIYLSYSAENEAGMTTKVIRCKLMGDALSQPTTILEATPYTQDMFHYGGGMVFGPDKMLYITVGERLYTEADQPPLPIAQNLSDRRGKIYRIHPDGRIPSDNPDFGPEAVPGIYALGIRAAQGITVSPLTGELWFTEHGTNQGDEINRLEAGANYGWPIHTTGTYRAEGYQPPSLPDRTFTEPAWYWLQTVAPTGLTFYTGTAFPQWHGNLIIPGLSRGSLWRVVLEGTTVKSLEELFVDDRVRARKAIQSPAGKLYILTDENDGKLIEIINKAD